jgi:hypothetical protein
VAFQNVVSLKNSSGQTFSNWEKYPDSSIDPEEMRYNPKNQISGMEQRRRKSHAKDFTVMQNPSLQFAALNGDYGSAFELPSNLNMQRIEKDLVVMVYLKDSLSIKTTVLYTNVEEPYTKTVPANYYKRRFDSVSLNLILNPVKHRPICLFIRSNCARTYTKTSFAVNGISTIQYYDNNQLLVERLYSTGKQACTIKVYLCDLSNATDVKKYGFTSKKKFNSAEKN